VSWSRGVGETLRITYVGQFSIGSDSPGLQRILGVSQALAAAGHEVTILGCDGRETRLDLAPGVVGVSFASSADNPVRRRSSSDRLAARLDGLGATDLVISYGGDAFHTRVLRRWSEATRVPRMLDSVEWYDRGHIVGGAWGPRALLNEYCMRCAYPAYGRVLAISSYLDRYYAQAGCSSVRIPPTLDVESVESRSKISDAPLTLVYAGTPGKKDLMSHVVHGVRAADPSGENIRLDVIGIDDVALTELTGVVARSRPGVRAFGRVSRATALELVAKADFIPLLRHDARYAHAGFPTKVAEAMAHGTPVITNLTSDLADVVIDGATGVVVSGAHETAFASAVKRAAALSVDARRSMRIAARARAVEYFDYRRYVDVLDRFVGEAVESAR